MRLRAKVRNVTGATTHLQLGRSGVSSIRDPETIEIREEKGAIFLLRFGPDDEFLSDTWHESVEVAKAQAKFEYGTEDGDWENLEWPH